MHVVRERVIFSDVFAILFTRAVRGREGTEGEGVPDQVTLSTTARSVPGWRRGSGGGTVTILPPGWVRYYLGGKRGETPI